MKSYEDSTSPLFSDMLMCEEMQMTSTPLAIALGSTKNGHTVIADLEKMQHVIIAGSSGAGKSVCIDTFLLSIITRNDADKVRMILIDSKGVGLTMYNGIPHLLVPVVTDPKKASGALSWAIEALNRRYKDFTARGVRNICGYNESLIEGESIMPRIIIVIDGLPTFLLRARDEIGDAISQLIQDGRAAGIHLVITTTDVSSSGVTQQIMRCFPSRIAFALPTQRDSRGFLGHIGAKNLLGKGDMLYAPQGAEKPTLVQGCFVSDEEVARVVAFVKARQSVAYSEDVIEHLNQLDSNAQESAEVEEVFDELLADAVSMSVEMGQTSISMLQRKLRVGYARAGRLIDEMTRRGFISEAEGAKPRDVLMSREEYRRLFEME